MVQEVARVALISCPECGRQISDQAGACPQCGMPVAPPGFRPVPPPPGFRAPPPAGRPLAVPSHLPPTPPIVVRRTSLGRGVKWWFAGTLGAVGAVLFWCAAFAVLIFLMLWVFFAIVAGGMS